MALRTLTKNESFDDFLQDITFDELDAHLAEQDYGLCDSYDIAPLDIASRAVDCDGRSTNGEPVDSPTAVDLPMRQYHAKPSTRRGKQSAVSERRRDRRRNDDQRERENAKRKIKQADFLRMRSHCFKTEFLLRDRICRIITSTMSEHNVGFDEAIQLLPAPVRAVMARAEVSMRRYREFTGQKHIFEQLNRFPTWLPVGVE